MKGSAVISRCGVWRYRLDRIVADSGPVYAFFGVNGSTATANTNDQTVRKWHGFVDHWRGSRFIAGNAFGFRAKDVRALASASDPIGPLNDRYLREIIAEADILVPCWGSRDKLPKHLRPRLDEILSMLRASWKPVRCLGLTASGDPKHPLTLGYATPLIKF